jgi:hypothetical protein
VVEVNQIDCTIYIGIPIKCLELYLKLKAHLWTNRNPKSLNSKHVVKKLVSLEIAILAFKLANFDLRTKSWNIDKTAIKGKMIWSMRNPCFEDKRSIQQLVVNVCKISARPNVSTISRCFKASSATILVHCKYCQNVMAWCRSEMSLVIPLHAPKISLSQWDLSETGNILNCQ